VEPVCIWDGYLEKNINLIKTLNDYNKLNK